MRENSDVLNKITTQLVKDALRGILEELEENGFSIDDPQVGFMLLQQSVDSIKGIMNMLDMETAYRTVQHSQGIVEDHAELIQLALLLTSARVQIRPMFRSIAEASGIEFEELEKMVLDHQDPEEFTDRVKEAIDFLARQTTEKTMRS